MRSETPRRPRPDFDWAIFRRRIGNRPTAIAPATATIDAAVRLSRRF
jgi:hypothetical protein